MSLTIKVNCIVIFSLAWRSSPQLLYFWRFTLQPSRYRCSAPLIKYLNHENYSAEYLDHMNHDVEYLDHANYSTGHQGCLNQGAKHLDHEYYGTEYLNLGCFNLGILNNPVEFLIQFFMKITMLITWKATTVDEMKHLDHGNHCAEHVDFEHYYYYAKPKISIVQNM